MVFWYFRKGPKGNIHANYSDSFVTLEGSHRHYHQGGQQGDVLAVTLLSLTLACDSGRLQVLPKWKLLPLRVSLVDGSLIAQTPQILRDAIL